MTTSMLDNAVKEFARTAPTADDVDPAFSVFFEGAAAADTVTAECDGTSLILIDQVTANRTTTIAIVSKTLKTLAAAVEATSGWHFQIIAGSPNTLVKPGGTTGILIQAAASAKVTNGLTFFWDTSLILARRICAGQQAILYDTSGRTRTWYARQPQDTIPINRDPIRTNAINATTGNATGQAIGGVNQSYTYPFAVLLKSLITKATATGGYTIRVVRCNKYAELDVLTIVNPTTATQLTSGVSYVLGDRFITGPGEWIYIELTGGAYVEATTIGSAAITVVTLSYAAELVAQG